MTASPDTLTERLKLEFDRVVTLSYGNAIGYVCVAYGLLTRDAFGIAVSIFGGLVTTISIYGINRASETVRGLLKQMDWREPVDADTPAGD